MRKFIINFLTGIMNSNIAEFTSVAFKGQNPDYGTIKISGKQENNIGTFSITRTLPNGDRCSGIPVFDMPFTKENIDYVAEMAVENL